jgi:hypothetical protein
MLTPPVSHWTSRTTIWTGYNSHPTRKGTVQVLLLVGLVIMLIPSGEILAMSFYKGEELDNLLQAAKGHHAFSIM